MQPTRNPTDQATASAQLSTEERVSVKIQDAHILYSGAHLVGSGRRLRNNLCFTIRLRALDRQFLVRCVF